MKPEKLIKKIAYKGYVIRFYRVGDMIDVEIGSVRLRMINHDPIEKWDTLDEASRAAFKAINNGIMEQLGVG